MLPLLVGSYEICIKKKLCWRKKMNQVQSTANDSIVVDVVPYQSIC